MIRVLAVMVALWAVSSLADVPGPREVCVAPESCVGCSAGDPGCVAASEDAGLVATGCTTQRGVPTSFWCPPGVKPAQSCGCSAVGGLGAAFAVMLVALRRRTGDARPERA